AVELRGLAGRRCELDAHVVAHVVAVDAERNEGASLAGANHARVGPRARRETLSAEMDRLEEVRLAGPVLARHEDDARPETPVERRVRAEVPERDVRDEQTTRRCWFTPRGGSA